MRLPLRLLTAALSVAVASPGVWPGTGFAEPVETPSESTVDHPPSDVARLSVTDGEVWVSESASGEWIAGRMNAPLVAGDEVSTGAGARAEIQLDSHNIVRLSDDSQFRLAHFTRERIEVEAWRGRVAYSIFGTPPVPVEIATPHFRFQPTAGGLYVIDARDEDETKIVVRQGSGVVVTPDGERQISAGDVAAVHVGRPDDIVIGAAAPPDGWEQWAEARDNEVFNAASWRNVNRRYSGAQDLNRYGEWRRVPDYGRVWVPSAVEPGWAPYRDGYWVWKPYWGWVWVSYEPWGWAPYHYGRWVYIDGYWAWWPGPVTVTYVPVWAPAYVVFLDFGHHHHGRFAWLPLGPADWYYPWWSRKNGLRPVSVTNLHVTNIVQVTNVTTINRGRFAPAVTRVAGVPAIRPLASPNRGRFSAVAAAVNDERVQRAASLAEAPDAGRRAGSRAVALEPRAFREARLVAGGAPAAPALAVPTRERSGSFEPNRPGGRQPDNRRIMSREAPPASGPRETRPSVRPGEPPVGAERPDRPSIRRDGDAPSRPRASTVPQTTPSGRQDGQQPRRGAPGVRDGHTFPDTSGRPETSTQTPRAPAGQDRPKAAAPPAQRPETGRAPSAPPRNQHTFPETSRQPPATRSAPAPRNERAAPPAPPARGPDLPGGRIERPFAPPPDSRSGVSTSRERFASPAPAARPAPSPRFERVEPPRASAPVQRSAPPARIERFEQPRYSAPAPRSAPPPRIERAEPQRSAASQPRLSSPAQRSNPPAPQARSGPSGGNWCGFRPC